MRRNEKRPAVAFGLAMLLIGLVAGATGTASRSPAGIQQALKLITSDPAQTETFSVYRLSLAQSE